MFFVVVVAEAIAEDVKGDITDVGLDEPEVEVLRNTDVYNCKKATKDFDIASCTFQACQCIMKSSKCKNFIKEVSRSHES